MSIDAFSSASIRSWRGHAVDDRAFRFDRGFTADTRTAASSYALLTGRYPHAHGAYKNNIELNRDERTIAHILRDNGYDTGYAGKWHLDGSGKPQWAPKRKFGFEDNRYMFNRGHWKQLEDTPAGPRVKARQGNARNRPGTAGMDEVCQR